MARRFAWAVGLGLGLAAGTAIGIVAERARRAREGVPVATAQTFESVLSAIRENFVDSLTDGELYERAAKGVVTTLGDPYSSLLTREEYRRYREILDGSGVSLGLSLTPGLTGLRVASVIKGSPADRAGINQGDFVLEVDGQPAAEFNAFKIATYLQPVPGRLLEIRVRAAGDSVPVAYMLDPTEIDIPAVQGAVRLTDSIGYLALKTISTHASRSLRRALDDLDAGELSGLIVDLRDNPGGRFDEGLAIADLFLDRGQRIGSVAKRGIFARTYEAAHRQAFPRLRLALLVNGNTASSAEIIAAALRDHDRAILVGERTRGKGLIQTTIPLGESLAVRLSTLRWESPGGTAIAGGILPDSVVQSSPAGSRIARLLGSNSEVAANAFEIMVRDAMAQGIRSSDSLVFGPAELERLRGLLRQDGLRVERAELETFGRELGLEYRRLFALMTRDRTAADRWALEADPVLAAALAKLATPAEHPPVASQGHHP